MLFHVPPTENAPQAHRVVQNGNCQAGRTEQNGRNNILQTDTGDEQHRAADGGEQDRCAAIRFNEDQTEHQRNERAGKNDAAFPGLHLPLVTVAIPCKHDDQRDFSELGRLKTHAVKIKPAACAIDFSADVRDEHQQEQKQREDENRPGDFFEPLIIEGGRRHAENEAERAPDELHHQVVRTDLRHTRAVEHHQPQRQQGGDAKRQSCDGDFHFNASKSRKAGPAAISPALIARTACRRARAPAWAQPEPARGPEPQLQPAPESSASGRP